MKKVVLLFGAIVASLTAAYAQPTLTAASTNPIAGDMFLGKICDTLGVSVGPAGAGVTWNFASLVVGDYDTTGYFTCAATPYCDSFSGSNLVSYDGSDYVYHAAGSSKYSIVGVYSGGGYTHFINNLDELFYPATYNSTHKDTASTILDLGGFGTDYTTVRDSFNCDGYGTLVLPTGTYTNVLRVHVISIFKDSIDFAGMGSDVSNYQIETYNWYQMGFHNPMLTIGVDTAESTVPYLTGVEYYTFHLPLGVDATTANSGLQVYPNPASDMIRVSFDIKDSHNAVVTLTDVRGKTIKTITGQQLTSGHNAIAIPVNDLPNGMYVVHLQDGGASQVQKVMINK